MSTSKLSDKIGQFVTVPHTVVKMIPVIGTDATALFVYLRYRTNNKTGDAFPSYDTIQNETGLSRRRVARSVRALMTAGLVERKRRFGKSTVYTLTVPEKPISNPIATNGKIAISNPVDPIISNPVDTLSREKYQNRDQLQPAGSFKTKDIQKAYGSCVPYAIDWAKGESSAAKWLAENGATPDEIKACYMAIKSDPWWADKPLSLSSLKKKFGEWKLHHSGEYVSVRIDGVINA